MLWAWLADFLSAALQGIVCFLSFCLSQSLSFSVSFPATRWSARKGGGVEMETDDRKREIESCHKLGKKGKINFWGEREFEEKTVRERTVACPSAERVQASLQWPWRSRTLRRHETEELSTQPGQDRQLDRQDRRTERRGWWNCQQSQGRMEGQEDRWMVEGLTDRNRMLKCNQICLRKTDDIDSREMDGRGCYYQSAYFILTNYNSAIFHVAACLHDRVAQGLNRTLLTPNWQHWLLGLSVSTSPINVLFCSAKV